MAIVRHLEHLHLLGVLLSWDLSEIAETVVHFVVEGMLGVHDVRRCDRVLLESATLE